MAENAWPMVLSPEREEEIAEQYRLRRTNASEHRILQDRIADLDVRLVSLVNHVEALERTTIRRDDAGERQGDSLAERVDAVEDRLDLLEPAIAETAALLRDVRLDVVRMTARKETAVQATGVTTATASGVRALLKRKVRKGGKR